MHKGMIKFVITTYNRKFITQQSLQNLKDINVQKHGTLHINDDSSNEYNRDWLEAFGSDILTISKNTGVRPVMIGQLIEFRDQNDYEFLYLTNNDIIHDPTFVSEAMYFYEKYKLPVTLFKTKYHATRTPKKYHGEGDYRCGIMDRYKDAYLLKSFAGVSLLLHKSHMKGITDEMLWEPASHGGWDWRASDVFGNKFICPRTSFCDHFTLNGDGSMHGNSDDVAVTPTQWLVDKRKEIESKVT
jgi:hypothetical protein